MVFIFKIVNGLLPDYLNKFVVFSRDIHSYPTRNRDNFYIKRTNKKRAMNFLFFKGLKEYDDLPPNAKHALNTISFKRELMSLMKK